jgi:hypothetical protein
LRDIEQLKEASKATMERVAATEETLRRGDMLFVRSKGFVAKIILAAEGASLSDKTAPTHTAIVIADHPVLLLEIVGPRTRILPLRESLKGAEYVEAFRPVAGGDLTAIDEATRLAVMSVTGVYGFWSLFVMACLRVFDKKRPARSSFKVGFGIMMPFLFPLFSAFRFRELIRNHWLLALAEGFFLLFLGFRFVDSLHFSSIWAAWAVKYAWFGWLVFLEIFALDVAPPLGRALGSRREPGVEAASGP